MKTKWYICRSKNSKDIRVESISPACAAETFAEEFGLEHGDVVHVLRYGKFQVCLETVVNVLQL